MKEVFRPPRVLLSADFDFQPPRAQRSGSTLGTVAAHLRGSIVVSISACHAEDPGSIPGCGVLGTAWVEEGGGRRRKIIWIVSFTLCCCLGLSLGVSAAVSGNVFCNLWENVQQSLRLVLAVVGHVSGSLWNCL